MKSKYLKLVPLILYPGAYILYLILYNNAQLKNVMNVDFRENIFFLLFIIYNIYVLFISVYNAIITSKDKYSPYEVAKINLTIKAWQIPAYIINFILGIFAFLVGPYCVQ